mmetsp:Transcript_41337/g.46998  ORF Transcript_41337/g.46998 Transcript_41337/m.46998 type:complete len:217 (-) Transcript_41337:129-779(-)
MINRFSCSRCFTSSNKTRNFSKSCRNCFILWKASISFCRFLRSLYFSFSRGRKTKCGFVSSLAVTGQKHRSSGRLSFERFCTQYPYTSWMTCFNATPPPPTQEDDDDLLVIGNNCTKPGIFFKILRSASSIVIIVSKPVSFSIVSIIISNTSRKSSDRCEDVDDCSLLSVLFPSSSCCCCSETAPPNLVLFDNQCSSSASITYSSVSSDSSAVRRR